MQISLFHGDKKPMRKYSRYRLNSATELPSNDWSLRFMNSVLSGLPVWAQTAGLLVLSNVFMTIAWYGHLKNLASKPWWIAALVSWGIALFEYLLQVPANRIGATQFSLAQLKIMQEVITLAVFVPFAVLYMGQAMKLDFLWAGLCLLGAVYFIFRGA
jgi:uncharacterized protein